MTRSAALGVVLAGGRGERMGGDKARAVLAGRTLLDRAVGIATAAGLESRICARAATALPPTEAVVWREPAADAAHPLAGLAHALEQAAEPIVAFPVDLPLLPPAALRALADLPEPFVVVALGGRPAALIMRATPEHAVALRDAAANHLPTLRTLTRLGAALVELTDLAPGTDPAHALFNVNTPQDLADAAGLLD